jgi:hypothetical protein
MDNAIGANRPFNQGEFAALGGKWVGYFDALKVDADAPLPALGASA